MVVEVEAGNVGAAIVKDMKRLGKTSESGVLHRGRVQRKRGG